MRKFRLLCAVMTLVYTQVPLRATALTAALDIPPIPTVAPAHNTAVAPGITLIPGTFPEGQQPDGNTVIFTAPDGLIVMDTGRHAEHTQQILDFAIQTKRPIKAIINSHWHLDHIGGNPRIRNAYSDVRIYASGALEAAKQGFLADYRRDLEGALQQEPNGAQAPGWRNELAIIAAAPPADERIEASGAYLIAGRRLFIHLERYAVTAGDVWVFDPDTHVLAAGDLVTLPVPFLDTACPRGWKRALAGLSRTRFNLLVPGHGAPMRRESFETYQRAFDNLLECAAVPEKPGDACVDGWLHDAGQLIAADDPQRVRKSMSFYVAHSLRAKPESIVKLCGTRPARG